VNAQAGAVTACVVCGDPATHTRRGRGPLCDRDSCLSRTPGTRDQEQGTRNDSGEGVRVLYVVDSPGVREEIRREPELTGLIRDHERGLLEPVDVPLGELPAGASPAMRKVAADIRLLLGLRRAVDWYDPLPYATRFCAERCELYDQAHASRVLRALERAGVVKCAGALTPRGKPDGTKTYEAP
jgi:hypothetical protein